MSAPLFLLSKDLLFITKVKEVALGAARQVTSIKSEKGLDQALAAASAGGVPEPGLLMVDLEKSIAALEDIAVQIRPLLAAGWRCVSFFSHVHGDLQERAEALGLGEVMPRSRFVRVLPDLLSS